MSTFSKIVRLFFIFVILNSFMYGQVRIMPLGDSITEGYSGLSVTDGYKKAYRADLWHKMKNDGYDIDFVGSKTQGYAVKPSFDYNHEGHGGWTTYEIADDIYGFLLQNEPDIILLHIGSNDASPYQENSSSVDGLNDILNLIDDYENNNNHSIKVVLSTIIERTYYHQTIIDYNTNLVNLANIRIAKGDDIVLVDMKSLAGLVNSDYADYVHPNNIGYEKMSTVWFNVLKNIIPTPSAPFPPNDVSVSEIEDTSAKILWQDNTTSESEYRIYKENNLIITLSENSTSYRIDNLEANTTYTYSVKACNSEGGCSGESSITFKTKKSDFGWLIPVYHSILY